MPGFQVSQAAEERVLHCFSVLRLNFAKFSFQKYSRWPAVTRLLPSLSHSQRPTVTRSARVPCAARATRSGPIHSPRPQRPAIIRSGQPHSPRLKSLGAARRQSPRPESLAVACSPSPSTVDAARVTRVTESAKDSVTRSRLTPGKVTGRVILGYPTC